MANWMQSFFRMAILLSAVLMAGCFQYDLTLQFDSQTHGQLVQQVHWRSGAVTAGGELDQWLTLLAERTQAIGGKTRFLKDDGFEIAVPFNNGQELEAKFNQFFNPQEAAMPFTLPGGDPVRATLSIHQGNRLIAIRNHISLMIDLTAVPDLSETELPIIQGAQLLRGSVTVTAPWGVRSPTSDLIPAETWPLTVGTINRIEADFWIPSPIGIGAIAIGLFVALGYGIKYGILNRLAA